MLMGNYIGWKLNSFDDISTNTLNKNWVREKSNKAVVENNFLNNHEFDVGGRGGWNDLDKSIQNSKIGQVLKKKKPSLLPERESFESF